MKKILLVLSLASLCLTPLFAGEEVFRYGIFVASSKGIGQDTLTGTGKKVMKVARLFEEYCRLDTFEFLEDPDREDLSSTLNKAAVFIEGKQYFKEIQLFFYYFGHGLPGGLLLGDELYSKKVLKELLSHINANIKFVFIDSCSSEILGNRDSPDFQTLSEGTVFISSSSLFEKAFANQFTPILKAGLMGDADGFVPDRFAANLFYNEILTKLKGKEKKFIQNLYGFNEYYNYTKTSSEEEAYEMFSSMGMESIPPRLHFSQIYDELLPGIKNNTEKNLLRKIYNYKDVYSLNKKLSTKEKKQVELILEKMGFKKDNFVTLVELFSYIRERVTKNEIIQQTPTINMKSLSRKEPVRLSYNENKIEILLKSTKAISIKRITGKNILEHLITLAPRLDDGQPTRITLSPGRYTFIIEIDGTKYRVDKDLSLRSGVVVLDQSAWSSRVVYMEEEPGEKNFFSINTTGAAALPLLNNESLPLGGMINITLLYNLNFNRSSLGFGVLTEFSLQTAAENVLHDMNYYVYTMGLYIQFKSYLFGPSYWTFGLGAGYSLIEVIYNNLSRTDDWGSRFSILPGISLGISFNNKLEAAIKYNLSIAVADNLDKYLIITSLPGIELIYKF